MLMKKLKNFLQNNLTISMTEEQEKGYTLASAERVLKYEKLFLYVIIGIQLYNIIYTLYYTKGTLHSTSSKVYITLYSILFVVSVFNLLIIKHLKKIFPEKAHYTINLQLFYGIFLMLWGACITVYDQRVSDNISVYLIIALTVSTVIKFKPFQSITVFSLFQIILVKYNKRKN